METYPCEYLTQLEALYLWQLAEENFVELQEDKKMQSVEALSMERPARSRLNRALELLYSTNPKTYHDVVAVMWFGRDENSSYSLLRNNARNENHTNYVIEKGPELHVYLKKALMKFGMKPLHKIIGSHYPS